MKKSIILLLVVLVILVFGGLAFFKSQKSTIVPVPTITPTSTAQQTSPVVSETVSKPVLSPTDATSYCLPQSIQATIVLDHAAGNVYGTLTLKNTSEKTCQILGGQFIDARYDTNTVKNITITHVGQTQAEPFVLAPNQTLYSQVHFPNGPQCQSIGITITNVMFSYNISSAGTVTFKDQAGKDQQQVQTCKSPSDMTEIKIWNMSPQPITP